MSWILDHWWIANAIPYFGFNLWLLKSFERDEGRIDELTIRLAFVLIGLWGVAILLGWFLTGSFIEWLEALVEGRRRRSSRMTRAFWKKLGKDVAKEVAILAVLLTVIDALYAVLLTLTTYHPSRSSVAIEVVLLCILVEPPARHYLKRRK